MKKQKSIKKREKIQKNHTDAAKVKEIQKNRTDTAKLEKNKGQPPIYHESLKLFKSQIRLRVTGFNQTRILNSLNSEFITITDIRILDNKNLEFTIQKKDSVKTFAILEKMCYNYKVVAQSGLRLITYSLIKHIGFLAGAVFFLVVLALSTQVVWRIKISGNDTTDSRLIIRQIEGFGVKKGSFKSKLDKKAVTNALRNMDGIAEGTVELVGTTIVIKVIEEKAYDPPNTPPEFFSDITSRFDAIITRIDVKQGTANYSVGDKVTKDSVLIRGESQNSLGETLTQIDAKGSVYGKVTFSQKHIFSQDEEILEKTGKQKTITNLSLFGWKIGKKTNLSWQKQVTTYKLFFIPIRVTRTVYSQTKAKVKRRDMDKYIEKLKDEAVLNNVYRAGGSEISTVTTLTPLDNGLFMLNIYIQAEILIGQG